MENILLYERENIARLRPHLAECTVLLKKNGAFPLSAPCTLAAYGNGIRQTVKGGTGSGEVNSRYFVNIEEGLLSAGFRLVGNDWHEEYAKVRKAAKEQFVAGIKEKAKRERTNVISASMGAVMKEPEYELELDLQAEAALYVLSRISGEGNDRLAESGDFELTASEVRDILALNEAFEKFILVINTGGPVDLTPVLSVGNILVLSQLGVETGHALADILLGKQTPSGKLAVSWSAYQDYAHIGDFGNIDDTHYREGIYVGYRWFDAAGKKALFPFGYGLSYSEFRHHCTSVSAEGPFVTVTAEVENSGAYKGRETLQLYLSAPWGRLDKEEKSLAAFAKTRELQPAEKEEVTLCFDLRQLSSYDAENARYLLEKGDYLLLLGNESVNVQPVAVLELAEDFTVRKVCNALGSPALPDYVPAKRERKIPEDLLRLSLDLSGVRCEEVTYGNEIPVSEKLNALSNEELAYLNIGAFDPKGGMLSVIGNASTSVAGAAGESTSLLKEKGIEPLVMADGPAGLRLAREYYVDKKGIHAIGAPIPESMAEFLPKPLNWFLNRKPGGKGKEIHTQYTTALPINAAIAQSWDPELAVMCGDIVGGEMEIYKVQLWLAPSLNIDRNVLCGRNFEYISEDPLLSGKMAAAITMGVQAHPGCGVTIKHYAANNQETNRYANSSDVSERALREIYLRGFEICIREADPAAVMSSYNLINGIHTSERRDLCTDILRDEFGFQGLLMTDWIIGSGLLTQGTKYGAPNAAKVAAAGHSLFMPGSKKDYQELLQGLKDGLVSREVLLQNAAWLLQVIERLKK